LSGSGELDLAIFGYVAEFTTMEATIVVVEIFSFLVREFPRTDVCGVNVHCIGILLRRAIGRNVVGTGRVSIVVQMTVLESLDLFNSFKTSTVIGELKTVIGELVVIIEMTLSLKDEGISKLFRKSLDEVVALVNVISDFGMECELIEFSNIFGEGSFSLTEIHEFEFSDEVSPCPIPIRGLEGDVSICGGIKCLSVVHKIFGPR